MFVDAIIWGQLQVLLLATTEFVEWFDDFDEWFFTIWSFIFDHAVIWGELQGLLLATSEKSGLSSLCSLLDAISAFYALVLNKCLCNML